MNWLEGLLLEESCIIYIKLTEPDAILQDFCKQPGQKLHLWNTSEATRNEQVQLRAGCGPKREKCRFISKLTTRWADSQLQELQQGAHRVSVLKQEADIPASYKNKKKSISVRPKQSLLIAWIPTRIQYIEKPLQMMWTLIKGTDKTRMGI